MNRLEDNPKSFAPTGAKRVTIHDFGEGLRLNVRNRRNREDILPGTILQHQTIIDYYSDKILEENFISMKRTEEISGGSNTYNI